jgi:hypothetical protein
MTPRNNEERVRLAAAFADKEPLDLQDVCPDCGETEVDGARCLNCGCEVGRCVGLLYSIIDEEATHEA